MSTPTRSSAKPQSPPMTGVIWERLESSRGLTFTSLWAQTDGQEAAPAGG